MTFKSVENMRFDIRIKFNFKITLSNNCQFSIKYAASPVCICHIY